MFETISTIQHWLLLLLVVSSMIVTVFAQPYNPFVQISSNALDGFSDPSNRYGPEDKLLAVNGKLVFVNLENSGEVVINDPDTQSWEYASIQTTACIPDDPGTLLPRDGGYTVGVTQNPSGTDRLIILGGSEGDNNVWFSDDNGITWSCSSIPQVWIGRDFSPIWHQPGIVPGDPMIMLGGAVFDDITGDEIPSIGMFLSYDYGLHYQRPFCSLANNCGGNGTSFPPNPGFPDGGDDTNQVDNVCWLANECYLLPEASIYPGQVASDWNTLWLWSNTKKLYFLNRTNFGIGWQSIDSDNSNSFGRKVFIRGTVPLSGCWFSTDFNAYDLYVNPDQLSGTNSFATARTATGPWTVGPISAPWTPRASAAVTSSWKSNYAWVAGGVTLTNGVLSQPTFGDVYQIDAGVCLFASNGLVCSGNGVPNLDTVTCTCNPGFGGDYCDSCLEGYSFGIYPQCGSCAITTRGACNELGGGGLCDPVQGCICNKGWETTDSGCNSCSDGFYGSRCASCPPCINGACSGSGTNLGTGKCICMDGFGGDDCSISMISTTTANANAAAAATAAAAPGAAIASISTILLAVIGILSLFSKFYPSEYASTMTKIGLNSSSSTERLPLISRTSSSSSSSSSSPTSKLSAEQVATRLQQTKVYVT
jgi:hypothetical protein